MSVWRVKLDRKLSISAHLTRVRSLEEPHEVEEDVTADQVVEVVRAHRRNERPQNVADLLAASGIPIWNLIPLDALERHVSPEGRLYGLDSNIPMFPLDWFDNVEPRMAYVEDGGDRVNAEAFLPRFHNEAKPTPEGSKLSLDTEESMVSKVSRVSRRHASYFNLLFVWTPVSIQGFNQESHKWIVLEPDSDQEYQVSPIYVRHFSSDPKSYVQRVLEANRWRSEMEERLKFDLMSDAMSIKGGLNLLDSMRMKIRNFVGGKLSESLLHEVNLQFHEVMNKFELLGRWDEIRQIMNLKVFDGTMKPCWRIFKPFEEPLCDIRSLIRKIQAHSLFSQIEIVTLISDINEEGSKILKMSLFSIIPHAATFDEFKGQQNQAITQILNYLTRSWVEYTTRIIFYQTNSLGKGWFDLRVKNWYCYEVSKILRLFGLVKILMQTTLRNLIENSMINLQNYLIKDWSILGDVSDDFNWTESLKSPIYAFSKPAFKLNLSLNENGPEFSLDPAQFHEYIDSCIDRVLRGTHKIPIMEPRLVSNLKFAKDLFLNSLGLFEKEISEPRNLIQTTFQKLEVILAAYLSRFKEYIPLYLLEIKEYVKNYSKEEPESQKFKAEIIRQFDFMQKIEEDLDDTVIIGPFQIFMGPMRESLIQKRYKLATELLEMFATRVKEKNVATVLEYRNMYKRLTTPSASIELLFETQAWIESVPSLVAEVEVKVEELQLDYGILDEFFYLLDDEESRLKWETLQWPPMILKQINYTKEQQTVELARFQKQQISEITGFEERCESLNIQIATFTLLHDDSRAEENFLEALKIAKLIEGIFEFGAVLNRRQELLDQPPVDMSGLEAIKANFVPYQTLWTTVADVEKHKENWFENPLKSINLAQVRRTLDLLKANLSSLKEHFVEQVELQELIDKTIDKVADLEPCVEVIELLQDPCFRPLYWVVLYEKTGMRIKYNEMLNFELCFEKGIMSHVDKVRETLNEALAEKDRIEEEVARQAAEQRQIEEQIRHRTERRLARPDL